MISRTQVQQRRVERALEALARMHEEGTLPPVLQPLLTLAPPKGWSASVELRHLGDARNGRAEDEAGWDAHDGEVRISFASVAAGREFEEGGADPMADLVEVLLDAERNPQLHFVALKFLRDRLLPQTNRAWAQCPQSCQSAIASAIERGLLHTSKKPNPRNPEFPVTAVHLNRDNPLVSALLQRHPGDPRPAHAEADQPLPAHAGPDPS